MQRRAMLVEERERLEYLMKKYLAEIDKLLRDLHLQLKARADHESEVANAHYMFK